MKPLDLYFGGAYAELIEKKNALEKRIANNLNINPTQIRLTNGSNGAIEYVTLQLAIRAHMHNALNMRAIIDVPNYFDTLRFLKNTGFETEIIERDCDFGFPYKTFKQKLETNPYLAVITDPNNPCGTTLSRNKLKSIIDNAKNTIVLVDRTCITIEKTIPTIKLLEEYSPKNIIALHSYSKTHSLSGKRIGYVAVSNPGLAEQLFEHVDDGRVSLDAMNTLELFFNNSTIINQNKLKIAASRKIIESFKQQYEWFIYSGSSSNFTIISIPEQIATILQTQFQFPKVNEKFGSVRAGYYRINISEPEPVRSFFEQYKQLLASVAT